MKLNLGCGTKVVDGWINVDYSMGARLSKLPVFGAIIKKLNLFNVDWDNRIYLHNLTKKFPWTDGGIDAIYSSHTLEHLSCKDGGFFITECYRVLKPQGVVRILVPDLKKVVGAYSSGEVRATDFLDRLGVLYTTYKSPLKTKLAPFIQYPHKCMYDGPSLVELMSEAGFVAEVKDGFASIISDIDDIEISDRVSSSVIVEAVKP